MRGKVSRQTCRSCHLRITPAYAGKSVRQLRTCGSGQDHPRLCGEKQSIRQILIVCVGSPPPMRGKGFDADRVGVCPGITPAYAGKSMTLNC